MEWQWILILIFASLVILMVTGMPVAISFMLINIVGMYVFFGGIKGLEMLILSIYTSVTTFVLLPIPLFILMGEVMFHSGIAVNMIDAIDKWLGRLPGRLGLLAVASGTVLSTLTGNSLSSTAILGSVLSPEMEKRGYAKPMSLGPILGSGGLAIMVPPSSLAIVLAAIGEISVGRILMSIIVPGLLMAGLYATYIIIRCQIQPSIAPPYLVTSVPLREKLVATARYILPLGLVLFLVVGVIFFGIASPSEAAATGVVGMVILATLYRGMNWEVVKKTISGTVNITSMIFLIIVGVIAFSQILSFSGATQGLTQMTAGLPVAPILIIITMQVIILVLGAFMDPISIMMVALPIFVHVIRTLGFNPVWFGTIFLLNLEMATTTPPFGMNLFVMKGVGPPGTTLGDCIRAALPFLVCDLVAMALIIVFPQLALWLPEMMR